MSGEAIADLAEDPEKPIEEVAGGLAYRIYAQDGTFVRMTVKDTPHYRRFIVWLRKFDRYGPEPAFDLAMIAASPDKGEVG